MSIDTIALTFVFWIAISFFGGVLVGSFIHAGEECDEDELFSDGFLPRLLTRNERLQGLADRGVDTWEAYREEV